MNRKALVVAILGCSLAALIPLTAHAQSHQRTGIDVFGGVGVNVCMNSDQADCGEGDGDLGSSWNLFLAGGYRFLPIIGAYLDLAYGRLNASWDGQDAGFMTTLTIMPTIRGYTTFAQGSIYGGLGIGYSSISVDYSSSINDAVGGPEDFSWSNLINFKLNAGADYNINNNIAIGVNVDYVFNIDGAGDYCIGENSGACGNDDLLDVIDLFQLGVFVRGTFPYQI